MFLLVREERSLEKGFCNLLPFALGLIFAPYIFAIVSQCNMQEGMEANPMAGNMKTISRVFAVLTVPLTMSFPKVFLILFG